MTLDLIELCSKVGKDDTLDMTLMSSIEIIFKSLSCFNGSFLIPNGKHVGCSVKNHGIDLNAVQRAFNCIQTMENTTLKNIVCNKQNL